MNKYVNGYIKIIRMYEKRVEKRKKSYLNLSEKKERKKEWENVQEKKFKVPIKKKET